MRTPSALPALFLAGSIAGGALAALGATSGGQPQRPAGKSAEATVTPVVGPSWLSHLSVKYGDTSLGRGSGLYGPAPNDPRPAERDSTSLVTGQPTVLTGADLYRLNCQACHRADGSGSPPEVKSVLNLIQGSSLALVRQQVQPDGKAASATTIRTQAMAARTALYRRIQEGGQRMPPVAHLQKADVEVLYAYLTQLAQTPDSQLQSRRTVSWARLGEQVVKGTCHICHDAVGPRPTPDEMLQGAIPPLSVLLADNGRVVFIRKVRSGAPVLMDRPSFHFRGRMPVFYYLRDEELAAAYDFLVSYPPQTQATRQH